jgi:hypothetical protein
MEYASTGLAELRPSEAYFLISKYVKDEDTKHEWWVKILELWKVYMAKRGENHE